MSLTFYNTLGRSEEEFKPLTESSVRMYHCGPTVYDRQHLGNLRSAVLWDILRRTLEYLGYEVTQVVNITDFGHLTSDADTGEDKMFKGLKREGLPINLEGMAALAAKYTEVYLSDRALLNCLLPTHLPKATEHIESYIQLIQALETKGFVYKLPDGLYFETSKDPHYGRLTPEQSSSESQSRTGEKSDKHDPRDFALWKFNSELGFPSPWGQGFPGWHIECSGMSREYLGETFDIHTGGIEHISIHHNNEIAQSENATGKPMAHFWLHNNHLLMPEGKMAKSSGNVVNLADVIERGLHPLSVRYFFLQAHYRAEQIFSWEALSGAEQALRRLKTSLATLPKEGEPDQNTLATFRSHLENDLALPAALALAHATLKSESLSPSSIRATILEMDRIFGLDLASPLPEIEVIIPEEIKKLAEARAEARVAGDFSAADIARDELAKAGWSVLDTPEGYSLKRL